MRADHKTLDNEVHNRMNKLQHGKYLLGFREISMAETGFHNKFLPPEISRIRKNKG